MSISINIKSIIIVILMTLTSNAFAAGSVSILYGNKYLDKNDWDPVDTQTNYGLGFEYKDIGWAFSLVVNYLTGEDSAKVSGYDPTLGTINAKITGGTTELGIGVRSYIWENNPRVFVEGGLADITARLKFSGNSSIYGPLTVSDSQSAVGFWFGAGVDVSISKEWSVGMLGRLSDATVDFSGVSMKAGGTHLDIYGAYHF